MELIKWRCIPLLLFCWFFHSYLDAQRDISYVQSDNEHMEQGFVDTMIKRKEEVAKDMVNKAVSFFTKKAKTIAEVCNSFLFDSKWRHGELTMFIFDRNGICFVHGFERKVIWKDFSDEKDKLQHSFIADMFEKGENGGWVNYAWKNSINHAYVKTVQKQGKDYIIGCGFYPQSPRFRTQTLIESVIPYIKEHGVKDTFPRIDNINGIFIKGDIYIIALDFDGVCVAHGEDLSLVGQNLLKWHDDENDTNHYQVIIDTAKNFEGKGWISYNKDGAKKIAYVFKVIDPTTNKPYALTAGYFPDVDEKAVRNLVKKGADYLKSNGREGIEREFLSKAYRYGSIRLFVYDTHGNAIVDAYDPQFIGQNVLWIKDPDGRSIIKLIIDQALKFDHSWVRYLRRNEYKLSYVEKVSTSDGIYVIGGGYFPASKEEDARGMVTRGVDFLMKNEKSTAFKTFMDPHGDFIHGDIHLEIHNTQGFNLVDSADRYFIWNDDNSIKDAKGRSIIDIFVATANSGGGWLEMNLHSALNRVFIKSVDKEISGGERETLIVSSGYFI